jgi:hypothetical protein
LFPPGFTLSLYTVVVPNPGTVTNPPLLSVQLSLAKSRGQLHVQPIPLYVENHCSNLQIVLLITDILINLLKPQLETHQITNQLERVKLNICI